jgi:hypothetical protein
MADARYPRDLRGYGRNPPNPRWPDGAKIAVQFVVNFEEGGENNMLHGDRASEAFFDYIASHDRVWVPTRLQIARHWRVHHMDLAAKAWDIGSL